MRRDLERATEWLASNPVALVAVVTLLVVVPIVWLGESSASDMQQRLRAERLALGTQAADRGADQIQTQLTLARQLLESLGHSTALGAAVQLGDRSSAKLLTGSVFEGSTDIAAVDVANAAGAIVVTVTGSSNFSGGTAAPAVGTVADRDYFRRALAGATTITGVTNETLQLDRPVVIAVPVSPENSQLVVGAVIGELSGSDLAGHLRSQLGPFEDLYI